LRLAARWHGFELTLDLLDVFARRDATNLDEIYTEDTVRPIVGGTPEDLVFLTDDRGRPAARRTSYNFPTAFQGPFEAVLGVHRSW
jgi:hypothetical protein